MSAKHFVALTRGGGNNVEPGCNAQGDTDLQEAPSIPKLRCFIQLPKVEESRVSNHAAFSECPDDDWTDGGGHQCSGTFLFTFLN